MSKEPREKIRPLEKDVLRQKASEKTQIDQFSAIQCDKVIIFLTSRNFDDNFVAKNNIKHQTNLTSLVYANGLDDNPMAFLGLAAGAHALNKMVSAAKDGNNVLIHCKQGKERTPSVVEYYLIRYHNYSSEKASELVKSALSARDDGIMENSTSLPHYHNWLNGKSQESLSKYEQITLKTDEVSLGERLSALYDITHETDADTTFFEVKNKKTLNAILRKPDVKQSNELEGTPKNPLFQTGLEQDTSRRSASKEEPKASEKHPEASVAPEQPIKPRRSARQAEMAKKHSNQDPTNTLASSQPLSIPTSSTKPSTPGDSHSSTELTNKIKDTFNEIKANEMKKKEHPATDSPTPKGS